MQSDLDSTGNTADNFHFAGFYIMVSDFPILLFYSYFNLPFQRL